MMSRLFGRLLTATNTCLHTHARTHTPLCTDVSSTELELYYRQRVNSRKPQIANGEGLRGLLPLHHYRTFIYVSRVSQLLPLVCVSELKK